MKPDTPACRRWQERARDISWFMRILQQKCTTWFNKTRMKGRNGPLWTDRFKNTLLESGEAVWSCWTYIENNPVRAGLVKDASTYRYSSFGIWSQSGRHPFSRHLHRTVLPMLTDLFGLKTLDAIRSALARALARKAEHDKLQSDILLSSQCRVRYWVRGLVIGSEQFLQEVAATCRYFCGVRQRAPVRLQTELGQTLFSCKRVAAC